MINKHKFNHHLKIHYLNACSILLQIKLAFHPYNNSNCSKISCIPYGVNYFSTKKKRSMAPKAQSFKPHQPKKTNQFSPQKRSAKEIREMQVVSQGEYDMMAIQKIRQEQCIRLQKGIKQMCQATYQKSGKKQNEKEEDIYKLKQANIMFSKIVGRASMGTLLLCIAMSFCGISQLIQIQLLLKPTMMFYGAMNMGYSISAWIILQSLGLYTQNRNIDQLKYCNKLFIVNTIIPSISLILLLCCLHSSHFLLFHLLVLKSSLHFYYSFNKLMFRNGKQQLLKNDKKTKKTLQLYYLSSILLIIYSLNVCFKIYLFGSQYYDNKAKYKYETLKNYLEKDSIKIINKTQINALINEELN